jgi:O-antigen/teichoic acid export membrane protein
VQLTQLIHGNRLMARIMRSASWVIVGYGTSQALRLASNLILARILFPEAFGLMALITVVTIGLSLFSDVGISPSISQSKRGDDPEFLDTAWTIQVIRGVILTVITFLLARPMAEFYDEPLLATYLPVAGLSLLVAGFIPTRVETATRHLMLGRLTGLDLTAQVIGLAVMIGLALLTGSVFALVLGTVVQTIVRLILTSRYLPGHRNRLRWDKSSGQELIGFGKWIFLSTAFFFLSSQGDKAILGKYLSLSSLGIYNIGFFLANFPLALGMNLTHKLLIPIYRECPPWESAENAAKISRMRHLITLLIMGMLAVMALSGPWLIGVLYDDRYALAGGIVVLISMAKMIQSIGLTYDNTALAAGNSRAFFVYTASRATFQVTFLLIGVINFGLIGALIGLACAAMLTHPVLIWLSRKHRAWDPKHDLIWFGILICLATAVLWLNGGAIRALEQMI